MNFEANIINANIDDFFNNLEMKIRSVFYLVINVPNNWLTMKKCI